MADPISKAGSTQLIVALLVGIAVIVGLITWLKMHPFLALILGSARWPSSRGSLRRQD